ncbi:MAG: polysaccharide pyruvyl transferase family protein, partial [Eggerthellaceae bacterium]|nr:polysaccharide pyruvyl transferase family protein [Eggerthellaceae bacterium]
GILCLQDATPARHALIRALKDEPGMGSSPVRCFGKGWPANWTADPEGTGAIYALKSTHTAVVFADGEDAPNERLLGMALAQGATGLSYGGVRLAGLWAGLMSDVLDQDSFIEAGVASMNTAAQRMKVSSPAAERGLLDEDVDALVASLRADFGMPGCENPRTVVCVLGYVGKNNYGDEHILATVERRVRLRVPGSTVIAISDDPVHTLEHRGMFAITMADKHVLDETVRHSAVAVVIAGLLVAQGVRWGMGKAELISCMDHSTIYGIAALSTLCSLNDTKMVLYGIGAGPLDLVDAKKLVSLAGRLDAMFIARDEDTEALIRRAGVDDDHVTAKADVAFLGETPHTAFVDEWLEKRGIDPAERQILAISLRAYETVASDFPRRVACALDASMARYPYLTPVLCVLDPKDKAVAESVVAAMEDPEAAYIMDSGNDIDAITDLLSRAHAGLSMRYHCALVLMRSGKPCAGISYLPKVGSLFADTGCADLLMTASATAEEMAEKIALMMDGYEGLTERVREGVAKLTALSAESEEYLIAQVEHFGAPKRFDMPREVFPQTVSFSERDRARVKAELEARVAKLEAERDEVVRSTSTRALRAGRAARSMARRLRGRK